MNSNKENFWRFNEGEILREVEEYIISTYNAHYTNGDYKRLQAIDLIAAIGDGVSFCRDNILKYAARYGLKEGFSKRDALKIIHYGILMYHFSNHDSTGSDNYETI